MNLNSYKETWGTISVDDPVEESLKKIDALLAAGVDVNLRNNDYEKHEDTILLHFACYYTKIIKRLLDAGAKVDAQNEAGCTPLMLAVDGVNSDAIDLLLAAGARVDIANDFGQTALMVAAENESRDEGAAVNCIEKLVSAGAMLDAKDYEGRTALMIACVTKKQIGGGYMLCAKKLIELGANLNLTDRYGETALMQVADARHFPEDSVELAKMLVDAGADIEIKNADGQTAYDIAVKCKNTEVAKILKEAQGIKELERAIEKDKAEQKSREEEWGKTWGTINLQKDSDDEIIKKAQTLLDAGVDIDMAILPNYNRTPLMCAVTMGKTKFVDFLIANKANVNKTDSCGFTPLMVAVVRGYTEIVEKLIKAGANTKITRKNVSMLDMAEKYNHQDIKKLLSHNPNLSYILKANLFCRSL